MKKLFLMYLYLLVSWVNAAGLFAEAQSIGDKQFADEYYRKDLSEAIILGLNPVSVIVVPAVTGFYEHGLNFTFKHRTN